MIRYAISSAELRARIEAVDAKWFSDAAAAASGLSASPSSEEFKPLWSRIKQVYIDLQHSKCCFCEKPLEGKIEQDVEHFRPKAEVKPWEMPEALATQGVVAKQPADGTSEPGYSRLAYEPHNYAMACKTCNSVLKKNLFPIEGSRNSSCSDPKQMKGEKPLFVYPLSSLDSDPEELIEFIGLSPMAKAKRGYKRRRALATIEVFRLDDSAGRRAVYEQRAILLRLLFCELEGRATAPTAQRRQRHQDAIDALVSTQTPFANCTRSFARFYESDKAKAEEVADECLEFMKSKSVPSGST